MAQTYRIEFKEEACRLLRNRACINRFYNAKKPKTLIFINVLRLIAQCRKRDLNPHDIAITRT